jgi:hypothetical protein
MSKVAKLSRLYAALQSHPDPGSAFEDLCVDLLNSMEFTAIFRRRGTEQGRDIDAEFAGFRWFFECKLVRQDVDTASFAYKFLQLDVLDQSQRPDFFVLLSNGSIKSILNDIVRFKEADRHTTYEVGIWANHTNDAVFDDIVLSEIDAAISFFQRNIPRALSTDDEHDLRAASRQHCATRGRFVERLTLLPLFRRHLGEGHDDATMLQFAHHMTVSTALNSQAATRSIDPFLLIIGLPDKTRVGLRPCTSRRDREELAQSYVSWNMHLSDSQPSNAVLFDEVTGLASSVYTLMTEWGAVATIEELPFCDPVVQPSELFVAIKEAAVRFRNYLKRGTLLTPCWIYPRIEEAKFTNVRGLTGDTKPPQLRFRRLERGYLGRWSFEQSLYLDIRSHRRPSLHDHVCDTPVCAQPVRVLSPPNDYRELGRAIGEHLWTMVTGQSYDIGRAARLLEDRLSQRWKRNRSAITWDQLVELRKSFDYILDGDLFPRPYDKFEPH